jgi:urease accessory protein
MRMGGAMLDSTTMVKMQRSAGDARVSFAGARLGQLRQVGSAKAQLPHITGRPEVVFLNTSGGLTSGDTLDYAVTLTDGAQVTATTQTAERAYRANAGPAHVRVAHRVGDGCWLDWLPQETILFDRSNLKRDTHVALTGAAGCLLLESIVLGRAAMGENPRDLLCRDTRRVTRDGQPVFLEPLLLDSATLAHAGASALLGGARAIATLVLCAQGAEDALAPARATLGADGVDGAASAYDGKLVVRLLAADGWPLRRQILSLLHVLRRGCPPPRVWQM